MMDDNLGCSCPSCERNDSNRFDKDVTMTDAERSGLWLPTEIDIINWGEAEEETQNEQEEDREEMEVEPEASRSGPPPLDDVKEWPPLQRKAVTMAEFMVSTEGQEYFKDFADRFKEAFKELEEEEKAAVEEERRRQKEAEKCRRKKEAEKRRQKEEKERRWLKRRSGRVTRSSTAET